jgi:hypothetical protein
MRYISGVFFFELLRLRDDQSWIHNIDMNGIRLWIKKNFELLKLRDDQSWIEKTEQHNTI